MHRTAIGYLAVFVAVTLWGLNFIVARIIAVEVPPVAFAFWRWVAAAVLLLPSLPLLWRHRAAMARDWQYHAVAATTGIATYHICVYTGAQYLDIYSMPLLTACSGIFVIVAYIFMRRSLSLWQLLGTLLTLVGLGVLLSKGNLNLYAARVGIGEGWLLASAAMWGIYCLVIERRPAGSALGSHIVTVWFALPYLGFVYGVEVNFTKQVFEWSWQISVLIAYVAVFPSIICYWLWLVGTDRLGAIRAQAVYFTFPLIVAAEAWLLLNEELHGYHGIAAVFIVIGAILITLRKQAST